MHMDELSKISFLDKVRLAKGVDSLKSYLMHLGKTNLNEAVNLLNEDNLHYASLYVLKPEIQKLNLSNKLNPHNKAALEITGRILSEEDMEYSPPDSPPMNYTVLKWMLETGFYDDGLDDEYSEVLDICSAILTTVYKDKNILPFMAGMIFSRNRKQVHNYDLIWAYFESHDPQSLAFIAEGLHSSYPEDINLSRSLLNFVPDIDMSDAADKETQYISFINWLEENSSFLYFTGESFLQTSSPVLYEISHEARYLCKVISPETCKTIDPLTQEEKRLLDAFKDMDGSTKALLSRCSIILHNRDTNLWDRWIHYPIMQQIQYARTEIGGLQ